MEYRDAHSSIRVYYQANAKCLYHSFTLLCITVFALDVAQMLGPWATPWVQFTLHRIGISWQKDKGIIIVSECTCLYVCIYSVKRSEKVKIIIPIDYYNNYYYCDQLAISTNRWDGTCHL